MSNPIVSAAPNDEDELQAVLTDVFRANNWVAIREYTPDWSDHRVDILAEHDEYGRLGVETKYIRTERTGHRLGAAFLQVDRDYSQQRYNRERVDLWAIAPYFAPGRLGGGADDERLHDFIRSFLTRTGIGVIDCHATTLKAQFSTERPEMTIPIAGPYTKTHAERLNCDALRDHVSERRNERR